MTEHKQINLRLADAIGWASADIMTLGDAVYVLGADRGRAYEFDYRDAITIWPIARRFRCFPSDIDDGYGNVGGYEVVYPEHLSGINAKWHHVKAATAEEAVAQAVICIAALKRRGGQTKKPLVRPSRR
jgi:hypothetical protein